MVLVEIMRKIGQLRRLRMGTFTQVLMLSRKRGSQSKRRRKGGFR